MLKKSVLALALAGVLATPAYADITINGFASIKAGITTGSDDTLYGYIDEFNFKNESLFAVQIKSDLGDRLSVTAQVMGRGSNDFDADFEWAFVSYQLTDELQVSAGRIRTPFYKYSDYMDVGYAYDWLRVPDSVYGLGFNNMEGVSLYHTTQLGRFDSSVQLVYGSYNGDVTLSGSSARAKIKDAAGAVWELGEDWYSVRAAYFSGKVTLTADAITPLLTGLQQNGLIPLADNLDFYDDKCSFIGFSFNIDRDDWLLAAEYNRVRVDESFFADRRNYYVSVGHRFNTVTPYVSFEWEDHKPKEGIYQPYLNALPPQLLGSVIGLVHSQEHDTNTVNLGLRYDFHPSAALKVQYSSQKNKTLDERMGLLAFGIDIVF